MLPNSFDFECLSVLTDEFLSKITNISVAVVVLAQIAGGLVWRILASHCLLQVKRCLISSICYEIRV